MRSWWSVAKRCATSRAKGVSDAASLSKPIENVATRVPVAAAAATTTLESTPPDRKKPSGTSAIICSATEAAINARSSSQAASSGGRRGSAGTGKLQKRRGAASAPVAGENTSSWAGGSLKQRLYNVLGAGTYR